MNIFLLIIIYNVVEEVIKIMWLWIKVKEFEWVGSFGINKLNLYIIFGKFIVFMIY